MNNCTCGIKFTGGLCSSWCDSQIQTAWDVHDVSGTTFVLGVTNFTVGHLSNCLVKFNLEDEDPRKLLMSVPAPLYHRIKKSFLLDFVHNGTTGIVVFQGLPIIQENSWKWPDGCDRGVFDTIIQHPGGKVILRTREH